MKILAKLCLALLLCGGLTQSAKAQTAGAQICPDYLLFVYNGEFYYQGKNCQTGQMTNSTLRYPNRIKTGCSGTGCQCGTPASNLVQAEYAPADTRVYTAFGTGAISLMGASGTTLVKANNRVFQLTSLRLKGKKTNGADNELECVVRAGCEVDPGTPCSNVATLVGNTLTYQGVSFTVSVQQTETPNNPEQAGN